MIHGLSINPSIDKELYDKNQPHLWLQFDDDNDGDDGNDDDDDDHYNDYD